MLGMDPAVEKWLKKAIYIHSTNLKLKSKLKDFNKRYHLFLGRVRNIQFKREFKKEVRNYKGILCQNGSK